MYGKVTARSDSLYNFAQSVKKVDAQCFNEKS